MTPPFVPRNEEGDNANTDDLATAPGAGVEEGQAEVVAPQADVLADAAAVAGQLQDENSGSSSSNDVATGSGSLGSLGSSNSQTSKNESRGDSGVNSEATTDVQEGIGGYFLIPIGPGRPNPSVLPNPDITSITFCKPYVHYMESACHTLIVACESSTLTSPKMVSSYRQLVGPCPHLVELCQSMSTVTFELGTFCLRVLACAYQMQRVIKQYEPTITRTENCRKLMITTLSKFIQCLQVLAIECEDLHAYYTYYTTTGEGLKFEKEFHKTLLDQVKANFVSLDKLVESLEAAQVMFENAFYKLHSTPEMCKNLGLSATSGSTSTDNSNANDTLSGPTITGNRPQGLTLGSLRRGISSIGRKITDKIRKQE